MKIELICSGTELLTGKVNTNAGFIGSKLYEIGLELFCVTDTSDRREEFASELKRALDRSDIVITTGGLGPTFDDITVNVAAQCLGKQTYVDENVLAEIKEFFIKRKITTFTKNNELQANIISGAKILHNKVGTAPGQMIDFSEIVDGKTLQKTLILLPGPPREMQEMFYEYVFPFIKSKAHHITKSQIVNVSGLGESAVEEMIRPVVDEYTDENVEFGILAHNRIIDVKYKVSARNEELANEIVNVIKTKIQNILGGKIFAYGIQNLENFLGEILTKTKKTLAVCESCTGGLIAKRITDIAGSSAYFWGGATTYSNDAKIKILSVSPQTLKSFGAVSAQTAKEMAEGLLKLSQADFALSTTGIAGPSGACENKPVGLVFIGLATAKNSKALEFHFFGNRQSIREQAADAAFVCLKDFIDQNA
ncbi:MAG: competence/damage-inducible protein A [Elusimicrobiota bacterium]|jgi:nicotinamide-nucleotide amidase|nr:competence/damage-inducible protein A [Elusimicrobiota bacterium]